ncbi:MAG TPA: tRNA epoxyqueuosine(34) reductase QueG [Gemmatimonadaceae bacterium]|nr:tRNA epoxyqueuosine(34) reductase QueG [Gemmatimonadaceae bacterium]
MTDRGLLTNLIKGQALGLGFDLVRVAALGPAGTAGAFEDWLGRGYAGEMTYLPRGAEKRRDSRLPFPSATSAIVVGLNYGGKSPSGPIARYARGDDYHEVMWKKLDLLHEWIEELLGRPVRGKSYVDTGPILERDLARKAGLGWFGKNTNLINPEIGSFFFIGSLLVDLELEPDTPFEADRCGTCTRCLDACPTQALVEPRVLDATRCISYLTIESREAVPEDLRESLGELVYGCDICQDVCPWNVSFARELTEPALAARAGMEAPRLTELMRMSDAGWREFSRGSAIKRAKRSGFLRNVAVALGNSGSPEAIPALSEALSDEDPLVREHVGWAVDRIQERFTQTARLG